MVAQKKTKAASKKSVTKTAPSSKKNDQAQVVDLLQKIFQELQEVNERLQDLEYSRSLADASEDDEEDETNDESEEKMQPR